MRAYNRKQRITKKQKTERNIELTHRLLFKKNRNGIQNCEIYTYA